MLVPVSCLLPRFTKVVDGRGSILLKKLVAQEMLIWTKGDRTGDRIESRGGSEHGEWRERETNDQK